MNQKELEGQLKEAQETIRELYEELTRTNEGVVALTLELEQTNKEMEAFSYSVSHDLRAPLRHLIGFTEMLKDHASEILDEKNRRYLDIISDSAKRMNGMIDDLLTFSRIGRSEIIKTQFDLNKLIKEIIDELKPDTKGRDIEWVIHNLPEIQGDLSLLRLVFTNLISNAVKFTRTKPKAKIEIGYTVNKDHIIYYIKDNGVGFDNTYRDKLFMVFQRLHRFEDFEGTGIGLANVKSIIHRHGGKVWAEGKEGEEATFFFTLPSPRTTDNSGDL